jgi:hypothetical protein
MIFYTKIFWNSVLGAHYGAHPNAGLAENILKMESAPYLEIPEISLISYVKPIEKYLALEPLHDAEMRKSKNSS